MKITLITTNGLSEAFYSWPERLQARALVQRGHSVKAYTYLGNKDWNNQKHEVIDGVEVTRVRRKDWLSFDLGGAMWRDGKPDVVHLHHLSNQLAFQATLTCKVRGVPVVMTPHGPFHDPYLVADRDRPLDQPAFYDQIIQTPKQLFKHLTSSISVLRKRNDSKIPPSPTRQRVAPTRGEGANIWSSDLPPTTYHLPNVNRQSFKRAIKNYLTHSPLQMVDQIIVLSEHEREVMLKLGLPDKKIAVIPNAIDPEWLNNIKPAPKQEGELRILYLGQLKYRKGFDLLAKAIPQVAARFPQARFIFGTHSPIERQDLLKLLDEGGVRHLVELPNETSDEQKAALFLSSDLYVLPTRYEGFGIPIIEAMSAGCPVISSRIPVVDEIIQDEQNGLLFEYNNSDDLAHTIIHALENPALRHKLAENGRQSVQQYYTDAVVDKIEKLYREVDSRK